MDSFGNLSNDIERILLTKERLADITAKIGARITSDYAQNEALGRKLIIVCILKGSVVFFSDLIREIHVPLELAFLRAQSYGSATSSAGVVEISVGLGLDEDELFASDVIVVEDILDSGYTLSNILKYLSGKGANSVRLWVRLNKPERRKVEVNVDYEGAKIADEFVVGYGLDFAEKYRNLPFIGVLKPEMYN